MKHTSGIFKNRRLQKLTAALTLLLKLLITITAGIMAWQYFQSKVYTFADTKPFSGRQLYNPYKDLKPLWLKGNLHAHSIRWAGITNGHQEGERIVDFYNKFGYDIAALSDYHHINNSVYKDNNIPIPVYEHGANIDKTHQLVVGATSVNYFDILTWQTLSTRQFILEELRRDADLVVMNHPGLRNGYPMAMIEKLSGYECMEVLNGNKRYLAHWDAALSAGKPVWGVGNDDCHDLFNENVAMAWNLINTTACSYTDIIDALKSGSAIAVRRKINFADRDSLYHWIKEHNEQILKAVSVDGNTMKISLTEPVDEIRLIGQNGETRKKINATDSASYTFTENDTYIRAELENKNHIFFLNPVIRCNDVRDVANISTAKVDIRATLAVRCSIAFVYGILILLMFPSIVTQAFYRGIPMPRNITR